MISHVDKKLKEKIQDQDYTVDFRRLLPKSRSRCRYDTKLQVVHQEGNTFFVPVRDQEIKEINSYKTWEVAFRVFMGIFNLYWPDRMQELLQYSHIIQTASQNHPWENVYNYDISFREIMTGQPNTHWGVISQQTWTLEFGDRDNKPVNSGPVMGESKAVVKSKNPCWRYNKGRCTFGEKCEFDHRCSHCGKKGHGRHKCYKRLRADKPKEVKKERNYKN